MSASSPPTTSKWFRQFHRWVSMVFTLTVAANFVAMTQGQPPAWITYAPLPPTFFTAGDGLVPVHAAVFRQMAWREAFVKAHADHRAHFSAAVASSNS